MRNSLKFKLLYYLSLSIVILAVSFSLILVINLNVQGIADKRFEDEHFLQGLQMHLNDMQAPLQSYLSSWSSSSLSRLLYITETISETIPSVRPVVNEETDLIRREIFFLIDAYLLEINKVIEMKRGRRVSEYTIAYEKLNRMFEYISGRINDVSLAGFRIQLSEYRDFLKLFRKIQFFNLLLILAAAAFVYSLLLQMINRITTPMLKLSQFATQLSNGDFSIPDFNPESVNEVNQVAIAFNNMKSSIHHYINELQKQKEIEQEIMKERVRNLKMEQVLKRMELYTMQAKMNPHFLFNTINTGVQLAIMEEADKTAEYMENLAALFRYNIREHKFFVPLRHEIEGLMSYFYILKIRFPRTLQLELDVQEDLLDKFDCPAMVIQPLVENSVLHAFKNPEKTGTVIVAVRFEDPVLVISVKDNGTGIPAKTVKALLTPHTHDYQLSSKVMGLENVIQRCYFFYPEQKDVIKIKTAPGKGTEIIIRLHTEVKPCIEL